MQITYPLLTVCDDSGAIVPGATVAIAGVVDKAGSAIASPGATVNLAGANVSVDYDAEVKGEAWITLAISKAGSTFTGTNAAPSFYLARDSGRVILNLDAAVSTRTSGNFPAYFSSLVINASTGGVKIDGGRPIALRPQAGVTAPTVDDALAAAHSLACGFEGRAATVLTLRDAAGNPFIVSDLDAASSPTTRTPRSS